MVGRLLAAAIAAALVPGCAGDGDVGGASVPSAEEAPPTESGASAWEELADAPTPRQEVVAVVVDDKVWVVGGFVDGQASAVVEVYDPAADAWTEGPDLPVAVHHPMAVHLDGELAVLGDGELAVLGGFGLDGDAVDDAHVLRDGAWQPLPPLPRPRGAGAAATSADLLVVTGGTGADGALVGPTDIFDGQRWVEAEALPTPRDHLAAVALDGAIWAVGGRELGLDRNVATLERFDPMTGTWEARAPMPTARGGLGATVVGGRIIAAGGEEPGGNNPEVEAYDPATDHWTPLTPMRTPRHGSGVVALGDRLLVLVGGLTPGLDPSPIVEVVDLGPA